MCSRLFKGNEQYILRPGDILSCVGPKGIGRAVFMGFARSESRDTLWNKGIDIDLHWGGFGERAEGTDYELPEGTVIAGIGIPGTKGIRILTKPTEQEVFNIIRHPRQPIIREPLYPLGKDQAQLLQEMER